MTEDLHELRRRLESEVFPPSPIEVLLRIIFLPLYLLGAFLGSPAGSYSTERGSESPSPSQRPPVHNIEQITWTDWKGRERKITIYRELHG